MNLPVFGIPVFEIPAFGIPVFGIPAFGIPGFGITVSGRVLVWVFPTFGIPAFGIPACGIPNFGIPAFGIPTIGVLVEFRHPLIRHPLDSPQLTGVSQALRARNPERVSKAPKEANALKKQGKPEKEISEEIEKSKGWWRVRDLQ